MSTHNSNTGHLERWSAAARKPPMPIQDKAKGNVRNLNADTQVPADGRFRAVFCTST
ncbi:hypothetical protein GCM10011405_26080 [Rufibacter glacialis]|nr:hypothetical protein GCM10011405_26080 [Rufibacter glacialis]